MSTGRDAWYRPTRTTDFLLQKMVQPNYLTPQNDGTNTVHFELGCTSRELVLELRLPLELEIVPRVVDDLVLARTRDDKNCH